MIKQHVQKFEDFTNDNDLLENGSMKDFLDVQDMFSQEKAIEILRDTLESR